MRSQRTIFTMQLQEPPTIRSIWPLESRTTLQEASEYTVGFHVESLDCEERACLCTLPSDLQWLVDYWIDLCDGSFKLKRSMSTSPCILQHLAKSVPTVLFLYSNALLPVAGTRCIGRKQFFLFCHTPLQTEAAGIVVEFPCQLQNVTSYSVFFFFFCISQNQLYQFGAKYTKMANDENLSVK